MDPRARALYAKIRAQIGPDLREVLSGLPRTFLREHWGAEAQSLTNAGDALRVSIRGVVQAHGLGPLDDAQVEELTYMVAIEALDVLRKSALSSEGEIGMMRLQSETAARGQLMSLVGNILASVNETAKGIVGKVGS